MSARKPDRPICGSLTIYRREDGRIGCFHCAWIAPPNFVEMFRAATSEKNLAAALRSIVEGKA